MDQAWAIFEAVSLTVKAGWVAFLAWALAQIWWYRRGRAAAFPPLPPWTPEPPRSARAAIEPQAGSFGQRTGGATGESF